MELGSITMGRVDQDGIDERLTLEERKSPEQRPCMERRFIGYDNLTISGPLRGDSTVPFRFRGEEYIILDQGALENDVEGH